MLDHILPFMRLDHHPEFVRVIIRTRAFPILTVICAVMAFFTGYALAASKRRTPWNLPFISDGGTFPPESCIFGLFLTMSAFFWICTVFSMHIRLNTHFRTSNYDVLPMMYKVAFLFMMGIGLISGVGVLLVGSAQETNENFFHLIGAIMAFCFGIFYLWILLLLTLILKPSPSSVRIMIARGLIIFLASCAFLVAVTNNLPGNYNEDAYDEALKPQTGFILRVPWGSELHGWHLLNTYCEWILALSFVALILTMSFELGPYEIHAHKLIKMSLSGSLPSQDTPPLSGVVVNEGTQTAIINEPQPLTNGTIQAGQTGPAQTPVQQPPLVTTAVQTDSALADNVSPQPPVNGIAPAVSCKTPVLRGGYGQRGVQSPSEGYTDQVAPTHIPSSVPTGYTTPRVTTAQARTPDVSSRSMRRSSRSSKRSNKEEYIQPSKGRVIYIDSSTNTPHDVGVQTTPEPVRKERDRNSRTRE